MTILLGRALVGLLAFDLLGLGRNFARLHHTVSRWQLKNTLPPPHLVDQVCRAINYACALYPKHVRCLQRSAVTVCFLRSQGVPAQMVVGTQDLPFKAHAWVEVMGRAINERSDVQSNYEVCERC